MLLSTEFLQAVAPVASAAILSQTADNATILTNYGIDVDDEVAMFTGQIACETGGFNELEENLYYTSEARLCAVWPTRFPALVNASPYVRNPIALANLVYADRLGNTNAGDGWKFRGSSEIQTTGRYNFNRVATIAKIDCINNPDLLRKFPGALVAACVFWSQNNLKRFVPGRDVTGLTKAIQGSLISLNDRVTYTNRAFAFLGGNKPTPVGAVLRLGMSGPRVLLLQTRLQLAGYYIGGMLDANFGPGTVNAVKDFQRTNGLVADGVVGPNTANLLNINL